MTETGLSPQEVADAAQVGHMLLAIVVAGLVAWIVKQLTEW